MSQDRGLAAADFRRLPLPALPPELRISQSVAWFGDGLLVGLGRGPLDGVGARGQDPQVGARLLRYEPPDGAWSEVWRGPVVNGRARDRSVRAMAAFADALYCAVGSLEGQVVILRSEDGRTFVECGAPGLGQGDADIASLRSLVPFRGRLHTAPTGRNRGRGLADDNISDLPVVLATDDPADGRWQPASAPGFGAPDNLSVNELALFAGCLYAATLNRRHGFELWKTDGADGPPYRWHKVLERGAWRGAGNPLPATMRAFGDALYIGTAVQRQGAGGLDQLGPIAPELIRVTADDRWELLCGEPRATPDGLKRPLTGLGPGFGDPFTQTFWRLEQHGQWLYLGAADWRFWPTFLRGRSDLSPARLARLRAAVQDYRGQYALWQSRDGLAWQAVTRDGLGGGEPEHYGIRELVSTPHGLAVAVAGRGTTGAALWLGAAG